MSLKNSTVGEPTAETQAERSVRPGAGLPAAAWRLPGAPRGQRALDYRTQLFAMGAGAQAQRDAAEKDLFDLSFRTRDRRLLSAARVEDEQGLIFQPLFPAQVVCQSCSGDDGPEMEGEQTCPHAQRHSESPGQLDVYIRTPRGDVFTYSTETPDDPSPVPFRDILRPVTYEVDLVSSDGATGRGGDARRHRVSLKILEPAGGFESSLLMGTMPTTQIAHHRPAVWVTL